MDDKPSSSERVYALDALRGIMMLLGLVIHTGITYGAADYQTAWPLKDPDNSILFDAIVAFIHAFRMPVFFVAAGYFAALLFYRKGPNAMLLNRFNRILLPFLEGVLIVYPITAMAFAFSIFAFAGTQGPSRDAWNSMIAGKSLSFNVAHLWFLYFLALYAVTGWLLAKAFQTVAVFTPVAHHLFTRIIQDVWFWLFCMAVALSGCLYWMGTPYILTNNDWTINPSVFVTYFFFFGVGWMIYKTNTLIKLTKYSLPQLSVATLLFLISIFVPWPSATWVFTVQILFTGVYTSLFIFGFIAFFLKYFNHYSKTLSYMMDASYWVYIIHLPVVAFVPGLLAGFSLPAFLKFTITLLTTGAICLASYKYLVRGSFIEMFLNGKGYKRNKVHQKQDKLVQA